MLPEKVQEGLLVLIPLKPILGMAYLKALQMELSKDSLVRGSRACAEDLLWSVAIFTASLNKTLRRNRAKRPWQCLPFVSKRQSLSPSCRPQGQRQCLSPHQRFILEVVPS